MRILIAVDRSEYSEIVIEHGLDQAVRLGATDLHFVTAVGSAGEIPAAKLVLDEAVRDWTDTFHVTDRSLTVHVVEGRPVPAVAALAAQLKPDLLVIGRFNVPSASELLVSLVECPVLVIGLEGHVLEAQCPACRETRTATEGEQLFCEAHASDYLPDLTTRIPSSSSSSGSRMW